MDVTTQAVLYAGPPTLAEAIDAAALLNTALGDGFTADVLRTMRSEDSILVRAESDGVLLGAATAHILDDAAKARLAARLRTANYPETDLAGLRVGELKASAVAPGARRRGIGTALVEARMDFLRGAGCSIVTVASWISTDPRSSSLGLLARHGFEPIVRIRGYWSKGSFTEYPCPDCGLACLCSAMIMVKDLRQQQG
ncbi:GNAT family N-acetyltransferase [Pseudarthrobacter sp. BIM B-2242]|uniref:GNAT family N-acetyltransferase n=1 Tax=Pseudarthrobacter sp. BIM B-2242 TaxID=2772401 RepID=UPI00168A62EE|nr:GNAT family N-acetyltransferase [Pseudarthrobacter sp. BIM B-2242]QOD05663.1 GNAT family N-acetyltransferase [Pseudarthrobacter sp. BIM B-2242]